MENKIPQPLTPITFRSIALRTALGNSMDDIWHRIIDGDDGLAMHPIRDMVNVYPTSMVNGNNVEQECVRISDWVQQALVDIRPFVNKEAGLIVSSTKGNINQLATDNFALYDLFEESKLIKDYLGIQSTPLVLSQACISGVVAIIKAQEWISLGKYQQVVVVGVDLLTAFTAMGFESFKALSPEKCKPFDAARVGINLGEAVCALLIEAYDDTLDDVSIDAGSVSNDANHISGPSRTGEELAKAITNALELAHITAAEVDYISAHGTATPYNDEMEVKAFTAAGIQHAPISSYKSYFGHTLGAAGVIETALLFESMKRQILIPSLRFEQTQEPFNYHVQTKAEAALIKHAVKTASGFGGGNACIVLTNRKIR